MAPPPNRNQGAPTSRSLTFTQISRLAKARLHEYSIQKLFKYGYRNREDISNLPPSVLSLGSKNILTNAAEQVGIRQGYVLDGPAGNQNTYGVDSSFDFLTRTGAIINLRKWGGNLEARYVNPVTSAITWVTILSSLQSANVANFAPFWDANTELKRFLLIVNGDTNVYEWSGAIGSVASVSNASGIIATLQASSPVASGGAGYVIGDILTLVGGNSDARFSVTSVAPGGIATISVNAGGSGYLVNDVLTLAASGGTLQATVKVTSVDGGGAITGISIVTAGNGYSASQTYAVTGGTGTLATITVNTVGNTITGGVLSNNGTGYSAATVSATGGTGTGATIVIASVASGAISLSGSFTTGQLGFYDNSANSAKFKVLINGVSYSYTSANGNYGNTLIGITPDPTAASPAISVGDAVVQAVAIGKTTGSAFMGNQFKIDLMGNLNNQIWYASKVSNNIYVSKTNDYTSLSVSAVRLAGEGALIQIDAPPNGFFATSQQMYVSAGRDQWWVSEKFSQTISNGGVVTATEILTLGRIKTTFNQAAQSQGLIGAWKNSIVFVSNEPIINSFGLVKNINIEPQMVNLSDPIKFDVDAYDFSNGQVVYDNYYIYVVLPVMGIVRMFNTNRKYWEAPQTLPVARLYHTTSKTPGAAIYGHSSLTNESYQLFTGYNDNGNPIAAAAAFPYTAQIGGSENQKKSFNKIFVEGYISPNASLMVTINYDFGGFSGTYTTIILGSDASIIFNKITDGSLGQNTLGSQPVGSILNLPVSSTFPKFRVFLTMPRINCFENQIVFSSDDIDFDWALLRFGPAISAAAALPNELTK